MSDRAVSGQALFQECRRNHLSVFEALENLSGEILRTGTLMAETIERGGKILICGNGGSAADAQHFAAELVGRYKKERRGWPAIALTTDTSILTAVGNDYGFDTVFARQVEALARPGDLLVGISTSGNSDNVLKAVWSAQSKGVESVGLLGGSGGAIGRSVTLAVTVPSSDTPRIQEAHIFIIHFWCELIENRLAGEAGK